MEAIRTITTATGKTIPLSPYNLIQEVYVDDPWKIMVCCVLLNCTSRRQIDVIRDEFFERWPDANAMKVADPIEVASVIRSLGFYNRRSKALIRLATEWTESKWTSPKTLHGIGQYALDSWNIFVKGCLPNKVNDHVLTKYVQWRHSL